MSDQGDDLVYVPNRAIYGTGLLRTRNPAERTLVDAQGMSWHEVPRQWAEQHGVEHHDSVGEVG